MSFFSAISDGKGDNMDITIKGITFEVEYEYDDGVYHPTVINNIPVGWMDLDNPELKKWYEPLYDELQSRAREADDDEDDDAACSEQMTRIQENK